jgi:hypothetical protein
LLDISFYLATRIQELCKNFKIIECTPKWDESSRQEREGFGTRQLQQTLAPKGIKRKREIKQCFVPCKSVMIFKE